MQAVKKFFLDSLRWKSLVIACGTLVAFVIISSLLEGVVSGVISTALMLFVPGYALLRLVNKNPILTTVTAKVGWSVIFSYAIYTATLLAVYIFNTLEIPQNSDFARNLIYTVAFTTIIPSFFIVPLRRFTRIHFNSQFLLSLVPFLLVSSLLLLPYVFNPLAQNNDGYLAKLLLYVSGTPATSSDLRPLFTSYLSHFSLATGLSAFSTFVWLPFSIFIAGILCFWAYIRTELQSTTQRLLALFSLVSIPVLSVEVFITRPQVMLIALTLPILILVSSAIRERSILLSYVAIFLSTLLMPVHELALLYVLTSLLSLTIIVFWQLREGIITYKRVFLNIVICLPYFLLLPVEALFRQASGMIEYAITSFTDVSFSLWFIDSYTTVDGAQLGWQGTQAAYYYLYNGLIFYLVFIAIALLIKNRKFTQQQTRDKLPAYFFLGIFFFLAEVGPRFGFFFLPNRSWPYIALAVVFLFIPILKRINTASNQKKIITYATVTLSIITGLAGTLLVSRDGIAKVFPEERGLISFLESTEQNTLILSNQPNYDLVEIYADKLFAIYPTDTPFNESALRDLMNTSFQTQTQSLQITTSSEVIRVTKEGSLVSEERLPIKILSKLDVAPPRTLQSAYFIFSKRKADGRVAERTAQYSSTNKINSVPEEILKYQIAYEDQWSVVYKLPVN